MHSTALRKQKANRQMLETTPLVDVRTQIGFFCECEEPACYRVAWLSQQQYLALQVESVPPLAPGHARPETAGGRV